MNMSRVPMLPRSWEIDRVIAIVAALFSTLLHWVSGWHAWASLALGCGLFAVLTAVSHHWRTSSAPTSEAKQPLPRGGVPAALFPAADLLQAMPDAAILLQPDGTIVSANEPARDQLQLVPGKDLNTSLRSPELASALARAAAENVVATAELRIGVPVERRLTARLQSLSTSSRANPVILATFRDRTSEAQLDQMRSDFVANASHELRTPLASLKGFIETLQGPAKDDPNARAQFLDIMQQEASRMSRLIDDLLSLSRIEMRVHVPPLERVDLSAVVREVSELLSPTANRAGQTIVMSVPEDATTIRGERDELVQVVQNLVQNAIKYGKQGGAVSIRLSPAGNNVSLAVADDGIGIAKEHLPRLTERFYRVSAKDSRERGGTGLGLAIVKHIVNRHRGQMDITSALGRGTTVTVSFAMEPTT